MSKTKKSLYDRITAVIGFVWLVSACAVDSQSWMPTIICAIATLWLAVYVYRLNSKDGGN